MRKIGLFVRTHDQDVARIDEWVETKNFTAIEGTAHSMKGAASMVGATAVSEASASLLLAVRGEKA